MSDFTTSPMTCAVTAAGASAQTVLAQWAQMIEAERELRREGLPSPQANNAYEGLLIQ